MSPLRAASSFTRRISFDLTRIQCTSRLDKGYNTQVSLFESLQQGEKLVLLVLQWDIVVLAGRSRRHDKDNVGRAVLVVSP